jgi:GntR family transcriptional regulator
MTRLDDGGGAPRYHQLARILAERIAEGVHPVGSLLPTELELCDTFGVSRYTVREALRKLTEQGLVQRRQGSGTQVVSARRQASYVQSMRSVDELFQYARDTRLTVEDIATVAPGEELEAVLGGEPARAWIRIEALRQSGDGASPICVTHVYLNPDFADLADRLAGHAGPFYQLIEAVHGVRVAEVTQEIRAEPMPPAFARRLRTAAKVWALRVTRRYIGDDGRLLQVSVNWHPADRFRYTMQLRKDGGL